MCERSRHKKERDRKTKNKLKPKRKPEQLNMQPYENYFPIGIKRIILFKPKYKIYLNEINFFSLLSSQQKKLNFVATFEGHWRPLHRTTGNFQKKKILCVHEQEMRSQGCTTTIYTNFVILLTVCNQPREQDYTSLQRKMRTRKLLAHL